MWQSLSLIGRDFPIDYLAVAGEERFDRLDVPGFPPLEALLMGVDVGADEARTTRLRLRCRSSRTTTRQAAFRRILIGWFLGITLTMLVVLSGLLTFVLLPVRRLQRQVREVEAGERVKLTGRYPSEIVGLADNLNTLIDTERRRLARYRNTLDDLAHSLKTPLAAMRTLLAEQRTRSHEPTQDALNRELERMDQRVSYQLRRARATGATGLGTEPVAVGRIVDDLKQTLDKVYRDKRVSCTVDVAPGAVFRGDPGDLTEILGNLMDNGYKYCKARVRVTATLEFRAPRDHASATTAAASRPRKPRRCSSAASAPTSPCRGRASGSPSCARRSSSIAARSTSAAPSSAAPSCASSSRAPACCEPGARRDRRRAAGDALSARISRLAADRGRARGAARGDQRSTASSSSAATRAAARRRSCRSSASKRAAASTA